jgi:hypothetical protein
MKRGNRSAAALAVTLCLAACAAAKAQSPPAGASYASVVEQICRRYSEVQRAEAPDVMYAQCMYARGYLVPGYSPSPNSPGYQGPLPGPATIGGGN